MEIGIWLKKENEERNKASTSMKLYPSHPESCGIMRFDVKALSENIE